MFDKDNDESVPKTDGISQSHGINHAGDTQPEIDDEIVDAWWRGVFCPVIERKELFRIDVEIDTAKLPRWEPYIHIEPRTEGDDDE